MSESEEYMRGHCLISTTLMFEHVVDWRGKCVLFFDERALNVLVARGR